MDRRLRQAVGVEFDNTVASYSDALYRLAPERNLNDDVFFEATRQEKLRRIRSRKCTHVIDDLEVRPPAPGGRSTTMGSTLSAEANWSSDGL